MIWLELALIGAVAGFLAGYLGIGGGLLLVPALTLLFSRDAALSAHAVHYAVATSLATMLVTSLSSLLAHHRRRAIDWGLVRRCALGLAGGAAAGAWLAHRLDTSQLAVVFGLFAIVAGLQLLIGRKPAPGRPLPGPGGSMIAGAGIGTISALVGIGGGSITTPWLIWHGFIAQRAIATAAACGYPIALAGTAAFLWLRPEGGGVAPALGYVHGPALAGVVVASALTAPLGAAAVHGSPPGLVKRLFGAFLLLVAARMLAF